MTAICPHCGSDLEEDQPLNMGEISFDPRGDVVVSGASVHLTMNERIILGSILKVWPRAISEGVLRERIDYHGDSNVVEVHICRIRRKIGADHIVGRRRIGWSWAA